MGKVMKGLTLAFLALWALPLLAMGADYPINDSGFGNTFTVHRSFANNAFETLDTLHSGPTAPSSPSPYSLWADTTTGTLKQFNPSTNTFSLMGPLFGPFGPASIAGATNGQCMMWNNGSLVLGTCPNGAGTGIAQDSAGARLFGMAASGNAGADLLHGFNTDYYANALDYGAAESILTLDTTTTTPSSTTIASGVTCGTDTYGHPACGDFIAHNGVMMYGKGAACSIPGTTGCTLAIPTPVIQPIGLTTAVIPPNAAANWIASTAYKAGQFIKPLTSNAGAFFYSAVADCTSGNANPTFNQTPTTATGDSAGGGTCSWLNNGIANQLNAANWISDLSVRSARERYSYNPTTGSVTVGLYSISSGAYTFNNVDAFQKVQLRYASSAAPGADTVQVQVIEYDGGDAAVGTSGSSVASPAVTYSSALLPLSPTNGLRYSLTPNGTAVVAEATGTTGLTATGTLAHLPVERGTVSFTNGITTTTDDGFGNLITTGTSSAGWIDYRTGVYSATFPASGPITASYTYGVLRYVWYANFNGSGYFPVGATWGPEFHDYGGATKQTAASLGAGNGSNKTFTGTLGSLPIIPAVAGGTVIVTGTVSAATITGIDNGAGTISGTGITGTISYSSGAISVTFTTAPDLGKNVTVTYLAANAIIGEDISATPPLVATARTYLGNITSISGNSLIMDVAPAQSGLGKIYHDDTAAYESMQSSTPNGGTFLSVASGRTARVRQVTFAGRFGVHMMGGGRAHEANVSAVGSRILCVSDGGGTISNPATSNNGPIPNLNGCFTYGLGQHDTIENLSIFYNNAALAAIVADVSSFNTGNDLRHISMNNAGAGGLGASLDGTVGTTTRCIWVGTMGTTTFEDLDLWGCQGSLFIGNGVNQLLVENGTARAAMPGRYFGGIIETAGQHIGTVIRQITLENVHNGIHMNSEGALESGSYFAPTYSADQASWEKTVNVNAPLPSGMHIAAQGRGLTIEGGLSACDLAGNTAGGVHILNHVTTTSTAIIGMHITGCKEGLVLDSPATAVGNLIDSIPSNGVGIEGRGNGVSLLNNVVSKVTGATGTIGHRLGYAGDDEVACAATGPSGSLNALTPTSLATDTPQQACPSNNVNWATTLDGVLGGAPSTIAESGGGTIGVFSLIKMWETITIADISAFTIPLPTNAAAGQRWTIELDNNAGATTGAITLASGYQKDASFTSTIASGKKRVCSVANQAAGAPVISACVDY